MSLYSDPPALSNEIYHAANEIGQYGFQMDEGISQGRDGD